MLSRYVCLRLALRLFGAEFSRDEACGGFGGVWGGGTSCSPFEAIPLEKKISKAIRWNDGMRYPIFFFFFSGGCVYRMGKKVPLPHAYLVNAYVNIELCKR